MKVRTILIEKLDSGCVMTEGENKKAFETNPKGYENAVDIFKHMISSFYVQSVKNIKIHIEVFENPELLLP